MQQAIKQTRHLLGEKVRGLIDLPQRLSDSILLRIQLSGDDFRKTSV